MTTHPTVQNTLVFIGRILFSIIFIMAGLQKLTNFQETVNGIVSLGLPYPEILVILAIIFELLGGLMILLGWHAKIGGLLILIFTLIVSFAIHHFWTYPEHLMPMQFQQFFKNMAIIGCCLYIISFGAGAYSFDGLRLKNKSKNV